MKTWLVVVLLAFVAFGVNWMAYEQRRANSGMFIPVPDGPAYHLEPTPAPHSF